MSSAQYDEIPRLLREAARTARTSPHGQHPDIDTMTHASALLWAAQVAEDAIHRIQNPGQGESYQSEEDRLRYVNRALKFMLDRETMKVTRIVNLMRQKDAIGQPIGTDDLRDAMRNPRVEPPEGWVDFGTHANSDTPVELKFSAELDDDGLPMWEQVVD